MRVGSQVPVHVRDGDSANKLPVMLHNQDHYATAGECVQCASGVDIKGVSPGRSRGDIALNSSVKDVGTITKYWNHIPSEQIQIPNVCLVSRIECIYVSITMQIYSF